MHPEAVDMFAGLGGWSEGARRAGLRVRKAANHLPLALDFFTRNHPDTEPLLQDIQEMDMRALGDLRDGFVLASPCCQGFSQNGQPARCTPSLQAKHQRDRNTAWAVLSAIDTARPRVALIENVPDFLNWDLFPAWCEVIRAAGYHVTWSTLDARTFGSAQHRERAIIVACRDREITVRNGPHKGASIRSTLDPDELGRWRPLSTKSDRMRHLIGQARAKAGGLDEFLWNNVSESNARHLDHDQWPTLTTKSGSQINHVQGDRVRVVNPRELARAQGFPDSYVIPSRRVDASLLTGNACDVHMSTAACTQALAQLAA